MRIFLSSTSLDLSDARQRIVKLLSVVPADLVHMETFGSDESQSVDYSLGQVRSSDLFVGVYAERYGTIDPPTGKSITELEYREAIKMLGEGRLSGLLVYILDSKAEWRMDQVDRDSSRVAALSALKEELTRKHTVTYFKNAEDLSLSVLRDVLRKIGVGYGSALRIRKAFAEPSDRAAGPLGMEHYTERDARWLRGREDDVASICDLVERNAEVLLIGDSGIGKTSLVQAGLFPALRQMGWIVASCRPLDSPDESIPGAVWHQLMEGPPPDESIHTILRLVSEAHAGQRLLVVVDQLEDVIPLLGTPKTSNLLNALAQMYTAPAANMHLLLCYRGDAEPKVGSYWQVVSGSAAGLPRHYLGPIGRDAARNVLLDVVALTDELAAEIVADTEAESTRSLGVSIYPPFLQMVAETLAKAASKSGMSVTGSVYESHGRARHIIGRYLLDQLRLLGPRSKESKAVLISLAGRLKRFRKSREEISTDTSIPIAEVDSCLADLHNLRLVHAVDGVKWEIVHDFLAQRVIEDLVAPEDYEARVFRDVVVAKAAAYATTRELLTHKEHLGAYAHRQRIVLTADETELVFASSLAGNGPARYFIRSLPSELPVSWAEERMRSPRDTTGEDSTQKNACRFLADLERDPPFSLLVEVFKDYKLQSELAAFIRRCSTRSDLRLLLKLRTKRAEHTREAAVEKLENVLEPFDPALERLIQGRRPQDTRLICRVLMTKSKATPVTELKSGLAKRKLGARIRAICGLAACAGDAEISCLVDRIESAALPAKEREVSGYALCRWAQTNRHWELIEKLLHFDDPVCRGALLAIEERGDVKLDTLLKQYVRLSFETSAAVLRTVDPADRSELERFVRSTRLEPQIRDIVIALLRIGGNDAARWVLDLIAEKDYAVVFWNAPILVAEFTKAVSNQAKAWLCNLTGSDEFWHYTRDERGSPPLPVQDVDNLYLFKRLTGVALAGLCDETDWPLLKRLVFHSYWQIQSAAADQIAKFAQVSHLDELVSEARSRAGDRPEPGIVNALSVLDVKLFGQT